MEKIRCAVLGATGVVGQHFLKLLVDHPYFELVAVSASDARAGMKLGDVKPLIKDGIPACFANLVFDPMDMNILADRKVRIAFSALPADIAKKVEKEAAAKGIRVFSNASAYRMDPQVPILIPEVNAEHLNLIEQQRKETEGYIVTNANCTTTGLAMALLPIVQFGIKKMIVASYQAISGAGYPGLSAMDIMGNVIPFIKGEEPKMRLECRKIFGAYNGATIDDREWEIHAHCVRVPTMIGHLISVHAEVEQDVTQEQVVQAIEDYRSPQEVSGLPTAPEYPVLYTSVPTRPQPGMDVDAGDTPRSKGMAVTIGRLEVEKNLIRFITLSNNLVRGAAGGSVLNAELAYRRNLL